MELHGLYEINDKSLINLYPSCAIGLLNVEYSIKVKVFYDSVFTGDDKVFKQFIFCDIIDESLGNISKLNNEYEESIINYSDNSQLNNINNINNNIINNEDATTPMVKSKNIDTPKNYIEDNDKIDLKDWVIIDK